MEYLTIAETVLKEMSCKSLWDEVARVYESMEQLTNSQKLSCALAVLASVVDTIPEEHHRTVARYCHDYILTSVGKRINL